MLSLASLYRSEGLSRATAKRRGTSCYVLHTAGHTAIGACADGSIGNLEPGAVVPKPAGLGDRERSLGSIIWSQCPVVALSKVIYQR